MVSVPARYRQDVDQAAQATGLPTSVVASQINLESGWNPDAVSSAGAQGIAQFMPDTWASLNIGGSPFDPDKAFQGYAKYMSQLLRDEHGNVRKALAAYNAGEGNLPAGYGYADKILQQSGQPATLTGFPGEGIISGIGSGVSNLFGDALDALNPLKWIQEAFGLPSEKDIVDLIQRGALILVGAIVLLVGIVVLVRPSNIEAVATGGVSKAVGQEKNVHHQQKEAVTDASEG